MKDKEVYIFDLDGTLAESKAAISPDMAHIMSIMLETKKVAIISGGNFPQFESQVISKLPQTDILKNLYIFPTSGSRMYVYNGIWNIVYNDSLTKDEKEKIISVIKSVLELNLVEIPPVLYGEQIEDRESEITLSYLGQHAPVDLKKVWDPDFTKRRLLLSHIEPLLPEFSVNTGGLTTIDVVKKGRDKAYGIQKLSEYLKIPVEHMCYFGDALYEGGNDAVVKKTGIECVQVESVNNTIEILNVLFDVK